jgi:hypothetical protein
MWRTTRETATQSAPPYSGDPCTFASSPGKYGVWSPVTEEGGSSRETETKKAIGSGWEAATSNTYFPV